MSSKKAAEYQQIQHNKKKWKQKIKQIEESLHRGENINAAENDKGNTYLHTAVLNIEVDVVKCLLNKNADISIRNKDGQTALDIAQTLKCNDGKQIECVLRRYQEKKYYSSHRKNISDNQVQKNKPKETYTNKEIFFQKRAGTSGIHGQLYESKLLSLILFRALHDNEIEEFYLGTNIEGLGAFDDIVFRYKKNGVDKLPKIIFVQTKHKSKPTKYKVNSSILHECLEGYTDVRQNFWSLSKNKIFKGLNIKKCDFIMFTSAKDKLNKPEVEQQIDEDENDIIQTSESGKIFQFHANEALICELTPVVKNTLAQLIAQRLSRYINKKTGAIMTDDLIKVYHVFLAKHVISIQDQINTFNNDDREVMFRKSFLQTKDEHLLLIKNTICKELHILKRKNMADKEKILKSLVFKVPANFGNVKIYNEVNKHEEQKQKTLKRLCNIFRKLFSGALKHDLYDIVEIKEGDLILQLTNQELKELSNLVGNVLILDQETQMLKFNFIESQLSIDVAELLRLLKNYNFNLPAYRFNVRIPWFPKLVLSKEGDDKIIVRDFLKQFKLYTNQCKEDEVEDVIKKEIATNCNLNDNDTIFKVKTEVVYLKFHDEVQSWWKQSGQTNYLRNSCQFYHEAKRDALNCPLISILSYTYTRKMKTYGTKFTPCAIKDLKITDFRENKAAKIMVFISSEIILTSIKCIQHFDENCDKNFQFLDLNCVIENYFEFVKKELIDSKCSILVLIYTGNLNKFKVAFDAVKDAFQGQIILITDENISDSLKNIRGIVHKFDECCFMDLDDKTQDYILKQKFVFQGIEVSVGEVLNSKSLHNVKPNIFFRFINHDKTVVGKKLTDELYEKTATFYIEQRLCRHVLQHKHNKEDNRELYLVKDNPTIDNDVYERIIVEDNVMESDNLNIKHKKGSKVTYEVMPKTVKDIEEKVIIISSEPGMGKTTFLSHVSVHTKQNYSTMWVSKIYLKEHFKDFDKWKSEKTSIDLKEAFNFLYGTIMAKKHNNSNDVQDADLFETYVFEHCYHNNQVILLFDGFDEVCPEYADEVIALLKTLKSSKVAHLWVTTRPYKVVEKLRNALGPCLYKVMPFNSLEQKQYFIKIWKTVNYNCQHPKSHCKCIDFILWKIRSNISDESFLGFPLHIYLIAELYRNCVKENCIDMTMSLWTLYEKFIEKNFFTIQFNPETSKDPKVRKMVENEYKTFLENHKKISAYTLFNNILVLDCFSEKELLDIQNVMDSVNSGDEKSGIIVGFRPKFVHSTFSDFFATAYICDLLTSGSGTPSFWEYLITDIFIQENKRGIRRFIDSKLREPKFMSDLKAVLDNYRTKLRDILLFPSWFLEVAIEEYSTVNHLARLILQCARPEINENNLDDIICSIHQSDADVVRYLVSYYNGDNEDNFLHDVCHLISEIDPLRLNDNTYDAALKCLIDETDSEDNDSEEFSENTDSEDTNSENAERVHVEDTEDTDGSP